MKRHLFVSDAVHSMAINNLPKDVVLKGQKDQDGEVVIRTLDWHSLHIGISCFNNKTTEYPRGSLPEMFWRRMGAL